MNNVTNARTQRRRSKPKGRHPHNRLSAAFVYSAQPEIHCGGNGLYLYVKKTGTRSWIQRLVVRGRKREIGLGSVIDQKRAEWRSPKTARLWTRTLEMYAFPRLGNLPVSEITSGDVLETLSPIWHTRPKVARAVRLRIRAVLEWAVAMDWRTDNPCDRLLPVLGPQHDVVTRRRALPHGEVAAAIAKVRAAKPGKVDTLAFEFLVLTAARGGGEVRGAVWAKIDEDAGVWTIPASRMKTAREHRVPLSGRALELLDAVRKLGNGENPIVFVNERGKPLTRKRPGRLLQSCGISAVPHGFRSSFRDWAA